MRTETIRLYEGREDVTLTTYLLDDSPELLKGGARPAIVICPGGAYLNCSDREAEPVALRFAAMGYHAFVLRYSVYQEGCGGTPDWTKPIEPKLQCQYPKQMREMGMAMRLIKSKGYQAVRKHCPPSVAVVIHDRFCLEQWEDFMPAEEYPGVVIDTHMYLFMLEVKMPDKQLSAYEKMIQKGFEERLERAEKFHPVIVGEWCIANKSSGIKELPENRAFHLSQTFVREWILEEEAAQRDMRASVLRQVLLFVLGFSFSRTVRIMLSKYKMDDTESSTQNISDERYMRIEAPV